MAGLSISRAWDESRSILARDGRLFASVALALVALPLAILATCVPGGMIAALGLAIAGNIGSGVGLIAVLLIMLLGQLSITRLTLGPSISVGGAIGAALRRAPSYIGAAFIVGVVITVAIFILALALVLIARPASQEALETSPVAMIAMAGVVVVYLVIFTRVISVAPAIATSEPEQGPLGIVRRAWKLTAGHFWRIAGFVILFFIASSIASAAIAMAFGTAVQLGLGPVEPFSTSAALVGLVEGLLTAVVVSLLMIMLARIYAQLAGRDASVSVPTTGI